MSLRLSSFFHVSARVFEFPLDRASRSFVSQVPIFGVCWVVFSVVFSVWFSVSIFSLLSMSKTFLEPNMAPSWGPRWLQNRCKVVLKTFDMSKMNVFKFPLFYNTFGPRGGPKTGQNRLEGGFVHFAMYVDFRIVFEYLLELPKSNLVGNMSPPRGPRRSLRSGQNEVKN